MKKSEQWISDTPRERVEDDARLVGGTYALCYERSPIARNRKAIWNSRGRGGGVTIGEIKWIKLSTDIFDNRKIRQIQNLPQGDTLLVIWLKLLVLAGQINDDGLVYITPEIGYTTQSLAAEMQRPAPMIQ